MMNNNFHSYQIYIFHLPFDTQSDKSVHIDCESRNRMHFAPFELWKHSFFRLDLLIAIERFESPAEIVFSQILNCRRFFIAFFRFLARKKIPKEKRTNSEKKCIVNLFALTFVHLTVLYGWTLKLTWNKHYYFKFNFHAIYSLLFEKLQIENDKLPSDERRSIFSVVFFSFFFSVFDDRHEQKWTIDLSQCTEKKWAMNEEWEMFMFHFRLE